MSTAETSTTAHDGPKAMPTDNPTTQSAGEAEIFKRVLSGNTALLDECLELTEGNLLATDEPYPMGLIIDTRSLFGVHLAIDMEMAGLAPNSTFEAKQVHRDLEATGQYQAARDKAVSTILEFNAAKTAKGEIPCVLGLTNRLTWESMLREYAAQVDDYYKENIEAIVAGFRQTEAKLQSGQFMVACIEHYQSAYWILAPNGT